ncbi:MAG: primosomal protein N' [Saprospiraceae bacterium]
MSNPVNCYVEVIVPLSLEGSFTYAVPEEFRDLIKVGIRVEVEFGKSKRYSALVKKIVDATSWKQIKNIIDVLDNQAIVTDKQFALWDWMTEYYLCSLGEIMQAALPASYKLSSETIVLPEIIDLTNLDLTDDEYLILEALEVRKSLSIQDIQTFLQKKSVLKIVKSLMERKLLIIIENLQAQNDIPKVKWIKLHPELQKNQEKFHQALTLVQKNENQTHLLLHYLKEKKDYSWIRQNELLHKSSSNSSVLKSLLKKSIFAIQELEKYIYPDSNFAQPIFELSEIQKTAIEQIKTEWTNKDVCLLKGITGSGKTHIYIQLIKETIAQGKQVLYLLPEIALTTQLVIRLKQYFGDDLLEYHSGISNKNRLAIWNACLNHHSLIMGARSSIFLPFKELGLIIIDEEHDQSYKQIDPAPRYNARDAALILAQDHNAKVILGSATPSLESYYNAINNKYGLIKIDSRYGESQLPEIQVIPLKEAAKFNRIKGHFSIDLLEEIQEQLNLKKQVIIFRNRRGYSPVLRCNNCNWEAVCEQCDIHLTIHKESLHLKCHICGIKKPIPSKCPQCEQNSLKMLGFGTEKIEEELTELFPDFKIQRFDLDAARTKTSQSQILEEFEDGSIQILVGTQMLTKGLDFERVALVGVLQADQILLYPDFRAQERAFQLLTQVSGRSGRREELGKVIIQAYNTNHPVLQDVMQHNFDQFFERELSERERFKYPPFVRIIKIEIRHRKEMVAQHAIEYLTMKLKKTLGKRILGPADSNISRIKGYYSKEIFIKLERNSIIIRKAKILIKQLCQEIKNQEGWSSLRIIIDVDPY